MNKQEKIIVALLTLALMGTFYLGRQENLRRQAYLQDQQRVAATRQAEQPAAPAVPVGHAAEAPSLTVPVEPEADVQALPEQTVVVGNEVLRLTLTTKGGAIQSATLLDYDKTRNPDDGPVVFDFSTSPALLLDGVPGLGRRHDFSITSGRDGRSAVLTATDASGFVFERTLSLQDGYTLSVQDTLRNVSAEARALPRTILTLGAMQVPNGSDADLAVDLKVEEKDKTPVIEIVKGTKERGFASLFNAAGGGCKAPLVSPAAPETAAREFPGAIHWVSVRERFFIQVLTPQSGPADGLFLRATRDVQAPGNALELTAVASGLVHAEALVEPGEVLSRRYSLYLGPRKLSELRQLGDDYAQIMRFGTWAFFCRALLDLLNFLYGLIPNYGVAIILLTGLVRLVLYPVNKRNAESMRKMQAIQPLVKEVQAKHKDDPKKLQAETMRIYGEHKVNPLASCLPMLIQLPVFIALFTVLRSAVELRYASFLWIADLSEPENLFKDVFGFGINILPIAMAGTMALQSYLTPTAGDRSQQKMMMVMMPAMMLVMFYGFPAALGLYWTVSQVFAIFGLLRTRAKSQAGGEPGTTSPPPRETRQMRREKARIS